MLFVVQMMSSFNAMERTLPQFDELFRQSGWTLTRVSLPPHANGLNVKIIGVPAPAMNALL